MSMQLVVCEGCARHVRAGEGACPFCGARAEGTVGAGVTAGRAALMAAITVAAGLSLAACYGGPPRPHTYTEDAQRPGGASTQVAAPPASHATPAAIGTTAPPAAPQPASTAPRDVD